MVENLKEKTMIFAIYGIACVFLSILFIVGTGSLIFSYIKINSLQLKLKQKTNLIRKVIIYQLFTIIFSVAWIINTVLILLLYVKYEANENKGVFVLTILSVTGI